MQSAPIPDNERQRLDRLKQYRVLDTPPEEAFDRITRIIAETIEVPIALVSLVDSERQWFKSKVGLDADETSREVAFCAHAILGNGLFVIEDASKDPRFADNPLVASDPSIRFYAGAPLATPDGLNLGTLCAIDRKPRKLTKRQTQLLTDLSTIVVDELELRVALRGAMQEIGEEAQKRALMDEFISLVTHELRTPLTSIRGGLGLLHGGVIEGIPERAQEIIALANRNVDSLLTLVNDLLDFQKFESGRFDLEIDVVDCGELVRTTCENMEGLAREQQVGIETEIATSATIVGDPARLGQVLVNLICNAIKFSAEGEMVTVGLDRQADRLQIRVTDRGPGIPEDFRDQVFERFAQATGQTKIKGTGLGLAISKAIVEAHRGSIRFDTMIGRGTTFYIELPLKQSVLA